MECNKDPLFTSDSFFYTSQKTRVVLVTWDEALEGVGVSRTIARSIGIAEDTASEEAGISIGSYAPGARKSSGISSVEVTAERNKRGSRGVKEAHEVDI